MLRQIPQDLNDALDVLAKLCDRLIIIQKKIAFQSSLSHHSTHFSIKRMNIVTWE